MNRVKLQTIAKNAGRDLDDAIELWIERAAIREFDGGMKRRDAESDAYYDVANMFGGRGGWAAVVAALE